MKKRTIIKRLLALAMCLALTMCLSGCVSGIDALDKGETATLPPVQVTFAAPTGDTEQESAQSVMLYVPDRTGTRLIVQTERVLISSARHPAETALRRLFAFAGSDSAQPLTNNTVLQLSSVNPVEISGDTATVNLGASAFSLSHAELYVVCQAIANTLSQWGDIRYVNVLVTSAQPGLDVGANVPAGCFTANLTDTIDMLTAKAQAQAAASTEQRLSLPATLYYPAYAGKGILAETRVLSFQGRDKAQMITTLLSALAQGAQTLTNVPAMIDLNAYLLEGAQLQDVPVTGGQRAVLRFQQGFNDALIAAGIPRSVMLSAITYTLTTFVPGLSGVTVYVGEELVSVVVPGGVYEGANETITFENDLMRRSDFSHFLLSNCTLYFADGSGHLRAVQRPIPYYETRSARYLLGCLLQGPQSCDSRHDVQAMFAEKLGDADVLGVALQEQTLLLNLSQNVSDAVRACDDTQERLLAYAIVNTLSELPAVRSVCFFFNGHQEETLDGALHWAGTFLRNTSIVQ